MQCSRAHTHARYARMQRARNVSNKWWSFALIVWCPYRFKKEFVDAIMKSSMRSFDCDMCESHSIPLCKWVSLFPFRMATRSIVTRSTGREECAKHRNETNYKYDLFFCVCGHRRSVAHSLADDKQFPYTVDDYVMPIYYWLVGCKQCSTVILHARSELGTALLRCRPCNA